VIAEEKAAEAKRVEEERLKEDQELALTLHELERRGYKVTTPTSKTDSSDASASSASSSSMELGAGTGEKGKRGGGRPKGSLGRKARALGEVTDAKVDLVLKATVKTHPVKWYPPILSYPILSYLILSFPILSYPIISYPFLSYPLLSYPILCYPILGSDFLGSRRGRVGPVPGRTSRWMKWSVADFNWPHSTGVARMSSNASLLTRRTRNLLFTIANT